MTLLRFMPKMAKKTKRIINLLKKTSSFSWDDRVRPFSLSSKIS